MVDENNTTTQGDKITENKASLTPESLSDFMKGLETLNGNIVKLTELAHVRQQPKPEETTEEDPEEEETPTTEVDLETMSRGQFMEAIVGKVLGAIEKKFAKPLTNKLSSVENSVEAQRLMTQINKLAEGNKDYWDFKEEMSQIAKENPGISPSRAYALAKAENPTKAAELAKKYAPAIEEKKPERKSFGGFTPGNPTAGKNPKMSTEEALNAAFDEVTSKHGDVFG